MPNALVERIANVFPRASAFVRRAAEGQTRPGPYFLPVSGGWLSAEMGQYLNWWQLGGDVQGTTSRSSIIEACLSAYSQTVAMCPGDHWREEEDGGRKRLTTRESALTRILRKPNEYQTISDFLLNLVRSLYLDGNAYALALRNDRYEINQLHLMHPRMCSAQVSVDGENIFYNLAGNEIVDRLVGPGLVVPQRDVLHVKLASSRNMLRGELPLLAAALDIAAGDAMKQQQISFYMNQARPSTVLTTDLVLTSDQVTMLRDRWNEQSRGLNAGGTPILTAGLKPHTLLMSAEDAQLAEILKLTDERVALTFRIPLQILGLVGGAASNTEALMQQWIASGLGFCLNHVEEAFGKLFNLRGVPEEYVEFDTSALLRSNLQERIEALARGVQGGIFSPNEARLREGLPKVEYGDEPRVQQQVVPLSAAAAIPPAPGPGAPPGQPPASGLAGLAGSVGNPKEGATGASTGPPAEQVSRDDRLNRIARRSFRAGHGRHLGA